MAAFTLSNPDSFVFKNRKIGIVTYPKAEVLDITGPFEVFGFANWLLKNLGICEQSIYSISVLADSPGPVTTLSGFRILADGAYGDPQCEFDTLLISGGEIQDELSNARLLDWIKLMSPRVNRLASICTGAFLLAESGLLNGCKATTHWHYCQLLKTSYPLVNVEADHIFVRDGHKFTSGGITSGIDLALAMVEEDWGPDLALQVARFMVVFLKRPGGQSQFSSYLTNQATRRPDLRELQSWIITHTSADLRIEVLAERMKMSPRNFARNLLESSDMAIETIALKAGFNDAERMRRAFLRQLGVNPQNYRQRFSKAISG